MSPRSLFTITEDSPDVTDHVAEPGESLFELDLVNVDAVVVTDAVLEGMPEGISSNELLVSNGDQSFSVIMSAPTPDLGELWTCSSTQFPSRPPSGFIGLRTRSSCPVVAPRAPRSKGADVGGASRQRSARGVSQTATTSTRSLRARKSSGLRV